MPIEKQPTFDNEDLEDQIRAWAAGMLGPKGGSTDDVHGGVFDQGDELEIARLRAMPRLQYEQARKSAAAQLGIRVSALDDLVGRGASAKAATETAQGGAIKFDDPEAAPAPQGTDKLLDALVRLLNRTCVLPPHGAEAIALWIAATYVVGHISTAPILAISSPTKRCGKSTVLGVLAATTFRAHSTSNISSAALFRTIERHTPTLIVDEADSFLRMNEELRGILNSGHTRASAFVIRTSGEDLEPRRFSTWGLKAVAAIGRLPDTVADRSIAVRMRRKPKGKKVTKLRHVNAAAIETLRARLVRWALDDGARIAAARPKLPDQLGDRQADNWEPLVAIADMAGPAWAEKARAAALGLSGAVEDDSPGVELLHDTRAVFERLGADRISTERLTQELVADPDLRWQTYNKGKPISQAQLARRLRDFEVVSKSVRLPDGSTPKGYHLHQFQDAFSSYLSDPPSETATPSQPNNDAACGGNSNRHSEDVWRFEKAPQPNDDEARGDVAVSKGGSEGDIQKGAEMDDENAVTRAKPEGRV